jgi:MmeI, target recognition domain/MmeI, C-terminal domain
MFNKKAGHPLSEYFILVTGRGGNLILNQDEVRLIMEATPSAVDWVRRYIGSDEIIKGIERYCLWISDDDAPKAHKLEGVAKRLEAVAEMRRCSPLASTNEFADRPHRFVYLAGESRTRTIAVGGVSSEKRRYLPVDMFHPRAVLSNLAFAMYDAPLWSLALIASRLHLVWIVAVCGKLETRIRYSNTLGWNTFPIPTLTEKMKADLTRCAEDILLAREAHFPATIADLYDPDAMPADLREAQERNDEVLERIYIGRRFRNDTERLEKLFELYTKMTAGQGPTKKRRAEATA